MDASGQNYKDTFRYTDVEYTPDGHTDVYRWEQTAIRTTIGFLGLASPRGFASLCSDHCMTCEALAIRAMRT